MNLCTACNEDFSSIESFSRHRVGKHEYDWSPEREDGRRCFAVEEMTAKGWEQNDKGRWFDPVRSSRAESLGGRPGAPARA